MIYELVYTSAPAGLRPGSSGYCTVQSSRGIPAPTVDLLESLSGYRHVFTAGTPEAADNPVNFGHYILRVQGRPEHVLSRVSDCPLDHTGRSNKLGHHMVINAPETIPAGPAWLLQQPGWMIDRWDGQVSLLNSNRQAPTMPRTASKCQTWQRTVGDAGWAGVLAESFLADPHRKVFLIYHPGTDILALFEEALALLPAAQRWEVTFSTYGAALPATVDCLWSGVLSGSQEEHLSKRFVHALRIDLTKALGAAPEMGNLVTVARTGISARTSVKPAESLPPRPVDTLAMSDEDIVDDQHSLMPRQRTTTGLPPSAPPPVTRVAKKSDTGLRRLILIVAACCLLFGGGTAASLVYFLRKPESIPKVQDEHDLQNRKIEIASSPPVPLTIAESKPSTTEVTNKEIPSNSDQDHTKPEMTANPPDQPKVETQTPTEDEKAQNPPNNESVVQQQDKPLHIVEIKDVDLPRNIDSQVSSDINIDISKFTKDDKFELMFPVLEELSASKNFQMKSEIKGKSINIIISNMDLAIPSTIFEVSFSLDSTPLQITISSKTSPTIDEWSLFSGAAIYMENHEQRILIRFLPVIKLNTTDIQVEKVGKNKTTIEAFCANLSKQKHFSGGLFSKLKTSDVVFPDVVLVSSQNEQWSLKRKKSDGAYGKEQGSNITDAIKPYFLARNFESSKPSVALLEVDFTLIDNKISDIGMTEENLKSSLKTKLESINKFIKWELDEPKSQYFHLRSSMKYSELPNDIELFENALYLAYTNTESLIPYKGDGKVPQEIVSHRQLFTEFLKDRESLWDCQKEQNELLKMRADLKIEEFSLSYKVQSIDQPENTQTLTLLEVIPQVNKNTTSEMKDSN